MPFDTEWQQRATPSEGVASLESAFRQVLGEGFDDGIRALVENAPWYRESLAISEVFRFWFCDNLLEPDDPQWIFQPVRVSERKYLCDALGVTREQMAGQTGRALAEILLGSVGFPT